MKTVHGLLAVLVLLVAWSAPGGASPARSAKILDLVGPGDVLSGGRTTPARILLRLCPGDEIRLPKGSRARLVYFSDQHWEELRGPCSVRVGALKGQRLSGPSGSLRALTSSGAALNAPEGNLEKFGGSSIRGAGDPRPTMKHALVGTPRFAWESAGSGPFRVEVFPAQGGQAVWTATTTARDLEYTGPALEPDVVHAWTLSSGGGLPRTGTFVILSAKSQEEVLRGERAGRALVARNPEDPAGYVMLADFYADFYLLEEAVEAIGQALALRPREVGLHRALARLYGQMGDPARAKQEEEAAGELERLERHRPSRP